MSDDDFFLDQKYLLFPASQMGESLSQQATLLKRKILHGELKLIGIFMRIAIIKETTPSWCPGSWRCDI